MKLVKSMKKTLITIMLIMSNIHNALACPTCEHNQPEPLRGITHGVGPQGNVDYAIIIIGVLIVSVTLLYSLKFLLKPGENQPGHIKNIVVDEGY